MLLLFGLKLLSSGAFTSSYGNPCFVSFNSANPSRSLLASTTYFKLFVFVPSGLYLVRAKQFRVQQRRLGVGHSISLHPVPVLRLDSMSCFGAIDGTHIKAYVATDEQTQYRGKNIYPTQNVMCACDFDMRFTFVMAGWEGTANDSRVFLEKLSNPENKFPMPPRGKFYVVDSGYTNM